LENQSVITRTITMAGGRFAPGHLGELTQLVPFEMVDAALTETGKVQSRLRDLPSRVVVYLLLAACLFPDLGYPQVWHRLVAGLDGLDVATPTAGALCQARRRVGVGVGVGVAPLRFLFDLLRGPAAGTAIGASRWRGLLVCAIDGTTISVPDSPANLAEYRKHRCNNGGSGYPLLRVMVLVCCGTRIVLDAAFGPTSSGETTYTDALLRSLHPGMIVLADRNFSAQTLLAAISATGAQFMVRYKTGRVLAVLRRSPDGSYLSRLGSTEIRVIDAEPRSPSRRPPAATLASTGCHHPARPPPLPGVRAGQAVSPAVGDRKAHIAGDAFKRFFAELPAGGNFVSSSAWEGPLAPYSPPYPGLEPGSFPARGSGCRPSSRYVKVGRGSHDQRTAATPEHHILMPCGRRRRPGVN